MNTPNYLFSGSSKDCLKAISAPLSWPSDSKKIEVTLFTCFRSLIVLRASCSPLFMFVPPLADRVFICASKLTKFYGVMHFNPQTLSPKF